MLAALDEEPRDPRGTGEGVNATALEVEAGYLEFACPKHGVHLVGLPGLGVWCRCGRRAKPSLNGTVRANGSEGV